MKNRFISTEFLLGCTVLAVWLVATDSAKGDLSPTRSGRLVYDPVTGRSVPQWRRPVRSGSVRAVPEAQPIQHQTRSGFRTPDSGRVPRPSKFVLQPDTLSPKRAAERIDTADHRQEVLQEAPISSEIDGVGSDGDGPVAVSRNATCCDNGDTCCEFGCELCLPPSCWTAGAEAVFLKPRFENNVAFIVMEADGASFETFTDREFNYDLELTPRIWIGRSVCDGIGWRATWWRFDHDPAPESVQPPGNGFGQVTHPAFGDVDISSTIPTDTFRAASMLELYTIDLEATKEVTYCNWRLGVGCGLRYASVEQRYLAELRDSGNTLRGQIDFQHAIEGFGPTISLAAARPLPYCGELFCAARASALFGDGESRLNAGENLDLSTPFLTNRTTSRNDLLSVGEIQLGVRLYGKRNPQFPFRSFMTAALEGQIWNGAGSAASADGNLGFFGLSIGAGIAR